VHLKPGTRACLTTEESELHQAFKSYAANAAEREGLTATLEQRRGRSLVADVVITGGAVVLAAEAGLKASTADQVIRRSGKRVTAGMQPLWFGDRPGAPYLYRVPSAAIPLPSRDA
jgi:hypothetical protein